VSHTFHLSAVAPSNYRFHVSYLQSDTDSKEVDSPMLIGEMDSSGSLNAHSLFHLSERIRAKAVFQLTSSLYSPPPSSSLRQFEPTSLYSPSLFCSVSV
ncbi:hypothetical protein JZ751_022736, partial [Albula glossodonta]